MIPSTVPPPAEAAYSDATLILIALGLIAAALLFSFLEIVIPSAGILTILAVSCGVGGVIVAFSVNSTVGVIFLASTVLLLPVALYYGVGLLRRTDMATEPIPLGETGKPEFSPGTQGVATSILRPAGVAVIGGRKVSVVTGGEIVEKDSKVEVIRCEGNRVVVRPVRA